jgi:hypothetical protein
VKCSSSGPFELAALQSSGWDNIYSLHVSSCRLAVITADTNIVTRLRQSVRLERANERASFEIGCAENDARHPLMSRPLSWTIIVYSQGAAYLARRRAMSVVLYPNLRSWMSMKKKVCRWRVLSLGRCQQSCSMFSEDRYLTTPRCAVLVIAYKFNYYYPLRVQLQYKDLHLYVVFKSKVK